jgi:hypothetical protein
MWNEIQSKTIRGLTMVILACGLCRTSEVYGEAVGSPASILKKGQWVMGLGGGGFLDRGLRGGAETTGYQLGHFRGYGLTDRLSFYGKIGGAYLEVDDASIKKVNELSSTHRFGAAVLVSVGLKARIWENAKKDWEWDGNLQYVDIRARHRNKNDGRWHEWLFATSVAKSFGRVKPYVGVQYSLLDFEYIVRQNGNFLTQGSYQGKGRVGALLGTDVYFGQFEDVIVNVETSYLNGPEVNVAVMYTF